MKPLLQVCCLFLFFIKGVYASPSSTFYKEDIKINEYQLVEKKRIDRTTFQYSYKISITNIRQTKLRDIKVAVWAGKSVTGVEMIDPLVQFSGLEKGETQQSLDTFTIQTSRTEPLDVKDLSVVMRYKIPVLFQDSKGNQIALFLDKWLEADGLVLTDFFTITENKNPTNKDLNTFPAITANFIEIKVLDSFFTQTYHPIEVQYIESPHRVLLLRENETEWTPFRNHQDKQWLEFNAIPENNRIVFALIRRNQ